MDMIESRWSLQGVQIEAYPENKDLEVIIFPLLIIACFAVTEKPRNVPFSTSVKYLKKGSL